MAWSEMKTKDADDAAEKQQQQQQPTAMVMKMKAVDAGAAGGEAITGRSRKEEGKEWGSGNGDRPTRVVSVVRMPPRSRATSDPSLSLHVEDVEDHQSSRNLWQVYDIPSSFF